MNDQTTFSTCIAVCLRILDTMLTEAMGQIRAARDTNNPDAQNLAVGTLLPVGDLLEQASTLYNAILVLHSMKGGDHA